MKGLNQTDCFLSLVLGKPKQYSDPSTYSQQKDESLLAVHLKRWWERLL